MISAFVTHTSASEVEKQADVRLGLSRDELSVDAFRERLVLSVPRAGCLARSDVVIPIRAETYGADAGGMRACAGLKRLHVRAIIVFVGSASA